MDTDFRKLFNSPADYRQPSANDLANNTQFPNMNSIEYRHRTYQPSEPSAYEKLAANPSRTTVLLAANTYVNRLWDGAIFVYKHFDDVGRPDQSLHRLPFDTNVNHVRFIDDLLFMVATSNGTVQVWSAQSEARQKDGYAMYQVASRQEHYGFIRSFDLLSKTKAITGALDGCLKVWSIEPCDLSSVRTFRKAHTGEITGLSANPRHAAIFASCSNDGRVAVWDDREMRPVVGHNESSLVGYTTCRWHAVGGPDKLYVGDETGSVTVFDPRRLDACQITRSVHQHAIHMVSFNGTGQSLCVLANSNTIKVLDKTIDGGVVYESSDAADYVRDICWNTANDAEATEFYAIGWNKHVSKHIIK